MRNFTYTNQCNQLLICIWPFTKKKSPFTLVVKHKEVEGHTFLNSVNNIESNIHHMKRETKGFLNLYFYFYNCFLGRLFDTEQEHILLPIKLTQEPFIKVIIGLVFKYMQF